METGCVYFRNDWSVDVSCGRKTSGSVALTRAQLSMLLEDIDWRRPSAPGIRARQFKKEVLFHRFICMAT